jgi:predicted DNA-binding transcriptional regulator YafY
MLVRAMRASQSEKRGMRWGVERRLELIEFRLFWEGGVNRADIVQEFDVSVPQASKDLATYLEMAPDNLHYDRRLKRYFASKSFEPKLIRLDADAYLTNLAATFAKGNGVAAGILPPIAEALPIPQRRIDPHVLKAIVGAARDRHCVEILYQSMSANRPEPEWRRIWPHAFANDGLRWHTRAFCNEDRRFKDFILSRCLDVRVVDESVTPEIEDPHWESSFTVDLIPNPLLSPSQRAVIAQDFLMSEGHASITVRKALLYYLNKRLRLDVADRLDDPREVPVIVANRDAFDAALAEAGR